MDTQLLAFQVDALADAVTTMGRSVSFMGAVLPGVPLVMDGVRSELDVDPGQLQVGGFKHKRLFQIRHNNPAIIATIKPGMVGTDDTGVAFKVLHYKVDHLGVLYFMGSVNA